MTRYQLMLTAEELELIEDALRTQSKNTNRGFFNNNPPPEDATKICDWANKVQRMAVFQSRYHQLAEMFRITLKAINGDQGEEGGHDE